jgi:Type ISP C-terminal specificity domain
MSKPNRMRLSGEEHGTIEVNSSLTLAGIPAEAFQYVLGTRSALEWVVDQYGYESDPEAGIVSQDVERHIEEGMSPKDATLKAMGELSRSLPSPWFCRPYLSPRHLSPA